MCVKKPVRKSSQPAVITVPINVTRRAAIARLRRISWSLAVDTSSRQHAGPLLHGRTAQTRHVLVSYLADISVPSPVASLAPQTAWNGWAPTSDVPRSTECMRLATCSTLSLTVRRVNSALSRAAPLWTASIPAAAPAGAACTVACTSRAERSASALSSADIYAKLRAATTVLRVRRSVAGNAIIAAATKYVASSVNPARSRVNPGASMLRGAV